MEIAIDFLNSIGPLDETLNEYLRSAFKTQTLPKNHIIVREGDIAKTIGFIEKGIVRSYTFDHKGNEHSAYFMRKNDVFTAVWSFFQQLPSWETVETLEPSVIHFLTFDQVQRMLREHPYFYFHEAKLLLKYYLMNAEREHMRERGGAERIKYLMENYADLVGPVMDKHLASYLSMTPQHFSKLKKEYLRDNGKKPQKG